jgi:hypothetical protein
MHKKNIHFQEKQKVNETNGKRRTWPVTILGLLLVIQGIAFAFLAIYHLTLIDISILIAPLNLFEEFPYNLKWLALLGLSLLGMVAGIGFLRMWSIAWMLAIAFQGFSLALSLILYFDDKPIYVYPVMAYCIFMVIYLHYSEVMSTFRTQPITEEWGGIDEEE